MKKVLIVDDDPTFNLMLKTFLSKNNYDTFDAKSAKSGLKAIYENNFDILLTDLRLPDLSGLELLKLVKEKIPLLPVVLMTSYTGIQTAVQAIKIGAFDYITKPINPDEILMVIQDALKEKTKPAREPESTNSKSTTYIFGKSKNATEINEHIRLVAPTNMSVVVLGESGTGKEYVSKLIHQESKRANKPFLAIDCGALPRALAASELFGHTKGAFTGATKDKAGQFEAAHGGTLFLDEIGNLPYEIQVQLLRALQERKVRRIGSNIDIDIDVRVIAATNEDLKNAVTNGTFREDLYHRLNEFSIDIKPLRARADDIEMFAMHFIKIANKELEKNVHDFDAPVLERFSAYSWPGNLRELKNVVKRAVLLAKDTQVKLENLPSEILNMRLGLEKNGGEDALKKSGLWEVTGKKEKELILETLQKVRYNKSKAAQILNIDRKTLYNKIRQYGIEA